MILVRLFLVEIFVQGIFLGADWLKYLYLWLKGLTICKISRWNYRVFQMFFKKNFDSQIEWNQFVTHNYSRGQDGKKVKILRFSKEFKGIRHVDMKQNYDDQQLGGLVADSGPLSHSLFVKFRHPTWVFFFLRWGSNPSEDRFWWGKLLILYCMHFILYLYE